MPRSFGLVVLMLAAACGSFAESADDGEPKSEPATTPAKHDEPVLEPAPTKPSPVDSTPAARPPCAVGFTKELMPLLVTSCATTVCHAEINEPLVDGAQPKSTYDALMAKGFGSIEWNDPHPDFAEEYDPALQDTVGTWRLCGAPFE